MAGRSGRAGTILIVDADERERECIAQAFGQAGYDLLEAAGGDEALEIALREKPSAVILEVDLPGLCGYELCRALRAEFGESLPIVFASAIRKEAFDRVAGLLLGADDYLAKPLAPDELLARVRNLIDRFSPSASSALATLTDREQEVLRLLARGLSQKQIAERLFISPSTANTHTDHIFAKLGVHSRAEAMALAFKSNLLTGLVGFLLESDGLIEKLSAAPC